MRAIFRASPTGCSPTSVFIDQVVFRGGDHFAADLKAAVTGAEVVIAIIGPGWEDELAKRAESKDVDYVRVELETALAAEIEIVPVIVGREQDHITADLIPVSLRPLCGLHVVHLRQHNSMMADEVKTKKLIADLGNMPGVPRAPTDRKPPGHPPTPGRYPIEPAEIAVGLRLGHSRHGEIDPRRADRVR
jgi:hypothetical protein